MILNKGLGMLSLIAAGAGCMSCSQNEEKKMNIVLIMADDFGYECIGANGSEYSTPNVDALAEQGIRFTCCHSNPLSTPSRVQLMTGKYNVKNYISFGKLDRGETTFGNLFADAGYATCITGKWQLGKDKDSPQHFGFQQSCLWQQTEGATDDVGADTRYSRPIMDINGEIKVFPEGTFGPDIYNEFAINFIREHKDEPFFVYYPMCLTHCPFVSTPDSEEWDAMRSPTYKGNAIHYPDMVKYTDKMVGKIVDELKRLGLMDNTMIIFTGDNGTDKPVVTMLDGKPYPGGKGQTIDSGTHVPMFVWHPDGVHGVNENLIDFTDFLPTLCDAARISTDGIEDLDGTSFLPQIVGEKGKVREWIYCWYAPRKVYDEAAAVFARNKTFKLYRDGRFYNVLNDFNEQNPILPEQMGNEEKEAYAELLKVIESYEPYAIKRRAGIATDTVK